MPKCAHCGSDQIRTKTLKEFVDDLMGAPFEVVLVNAVTEESCVGCGKVLGVGIPDLAGLIAAVAMTRALDPQKLAGEEIRFLRKAVGWKARELAEILEITQEHLSRCENAVLPLSNGLEKYLRHFACEKIKKQYTHIPFDFEHFERMRIVPWIVQPKPTPKKYRFVRVKVAPKTKTEPKVDGWKKAA